MKHFILFLGVFFIPACLPEKSENIISFDKERIIISRQGQSDITLAVEIADTDEKRARGLMYRTDIRDDEGMLFLFPVNRRASMWMANTPQSLDMLFIDEEGKITQIVEDTVPFSREEIRSEKSVKGVLELKAGTSEREGRKVGDMVEHSCFKLEKQEEKR